MDCYNPNYAVDSRCYQDKIFNVQLLATSLSEQCLISLLLWSLFRRLMCVFFTARGYRKRDRPIMVHPVSPCLSCLAVETLISYRATFSVFTHFIVGTCQLFSQRFHCFQTLYLLFRWLFILYIIYTHIQHNI